MPKKSPIYCQYLHAGFWKLSGLTMALMLVVMGGRFMTIQKWAVDLPYWDQWDGELRNIILPYLKGTLGWEHFFSAHNEHRVLWPRLLTLGLFVENGQWDNLLEVTVNTFIQCLVAASLFLAGRVVFRSFSLYLWWIIVTICMCLPFGFENTMMGFQSQFYMTSLFTILTIWICSLEKIKPSLRAAGVGILSSLLLFTMGAAFLCPLALILALLIKAYFNGDFLNTLKVDLPVHITLIVAVVAGLILLPHVPAHDRLKTDGIGELVMAIARYFSWPWSSINNHFVIHFGMATLIWLPSLIFLGALWLTRRAKTKAQDVFVLALLGWIALQALGMAYTRGGGTVIPPASRYADTLVFSLVANFLALWRVPSMASNLPVWKATIFVFSLMWMFVAIVGLTKLTIQNVDLEIPHRANNFVRQTQNVAQFIRDGDEQHLVGKPSNELPYPKAEELVQLLRDPLTKQVLPWSVREPIDIGQSTQLPSEGFTVNGVPRAFDKPAFEKVMGSYSDESQAAVKGVYHGNFTLAPTLPYLAIEVAGYVEENDSTLQIRHPSKKRQKLIANHRATETWSMVYLKSRGAGLYEVRASDKSETRWLAFSEPREIGRLSMYARILLEQYPWLLIAGLGLFCVVVYGSGWGLSRSREAMR